MPAGNPPLQLSSGSTPLLFDFTGIHGVQQAFELLSLDPNASDRELADELRNLSNELFFALKTRSPFDARKLAAVLVVANSRPSSPLLLDRVRRLLACEARAYLRLLSLPLRVSPDGSASERLLEDSILLFSKAETRFDERYDVGAPGKALEVDEGGGKAGGFVMEEWMKEQKAHGETRRKLQEAEKKLGELRDLQESAFEETESADRAEDELEEVK
ncbi:hypothetical protein JCM8547_003878 [Rhodosporidiobolus lusitaniae]